MKEIIRKVICDKCGKSINRNEEWSISISRWGMDDDPVDYETFEADLCPSCKSVLVEEVGKLGVKLMYRKG